MTTLFIAIIPAVLLIFWVWMALDFARNQRVPREQFIYWAIGFIFIGIPTSIYYYFEAYRYKD